jgi:predicted AlkP superfamily pyrophosphatase or phosphodiesterase
MRKFLLFATAILAGCGSQPAAKAQLAPVPNAPKLTIVLSIDQLSSDLFETYRPMFSGGLARLARGTVFRNGYQAHAATETCPGHSTLLTGNHPANTGIIANAWYDERISRSDKIIYCAEDESQPGTTSLNYKLSTLHLKVPTLGDLLKVASPGSRVVAVGGKDRSAMMMGGRRADQRWYWRNTKFETDLTGVAPRSVALVNQAISMMIAAPQPGLEPTTACAAKARVFSLPGSGRQVGNGRFQRAAGDSAGFRSSPALDGATLALAAGLIGEMSLGRGPAPDVLAISLAATDYVGHAYGTGGQEMCLHMLSLDRDLGDFFRRLDGAGLDYSVIVSADHGGPDIPERARLNGIAGADWVDPRLGSVAVGKALEAQLKLPQVEVIGNYSGDIDVGPNLPPADRARAIAAARDLFARHPQIQAVFTNGEVARLPMPTGAPDKWTLAQRVRASFDGERSGDLIVIHKPNIMPVTDTRTYANMHGSPWDYDRRVPIIFWRPGMTAVDRAEAIATVDIMPTLAAWLGLPLGTTHVDGRCLSQVSGTPCPR